MSVISFLVGFGLVIAMTVVIATSFTAGRWYERSVH